MAVECDRCGLCMAGCKRRGECGNRRAPVLQAAAPPSPANTRNSGAHEAGKYSVPGEFTPTREKKKNDSVTHRDLSLDSATVTDLSDAFGGSIKFRLPNARRTIQVLRRFMARRRAYAAVPQNSMDEDNEAAGDGQEAADVQETEDEDEDEDEVEVDDTESSEDEDGDGGDDGISKKDRTDGRRLVTAVDQAMSQVATVIAGGEDEASELLRLTVENGVGGLGNKDPLIENAKVVLDKTKQGSGPHRAVKAVLAASLPNRALKALGFGGNKPSRGARGDFASLASTGKLEEKRGAPRGKSQVSDEAIKNTIKVLLEKCSTSAWSMREHIIRKDSIKTLNRSTSKGEDEEDEVFYLPALHRLISRQEIYDRLVEAFPDKRDRLGRASFNQLASRLSRTQAKSLRALDYYITDLLHEPLERLKGLILDVCDDTPERSTVLKDLGLVYSTVQHSFPELLGSSDSSLHSVPFGLGHPDKAGSTGACGTCASIMRFFEDRLPSAMGGVLGREYQDIIDHSRDKALLYMGHSVRCAAQQDRISKLREQAHGNVALLIIDYMMKYEESRFREGSREHYGKRGINVHGAMVEFKDDDTGEEVKRTFMQVPQSDATQDVAAALANFDWICKCIREDEKLKPVEWVILQLDNAATYSPDVFSIACFDIARSHGLKVMVLIHNEAQDGKTQLDTSFYYFKRQLLKWSRYYTCGVLTPSHMKEAMEHSNGVKGMRFDIVDFDRTRLTELFADPKRYYGALKKRAAQVLPTPLAEARTTPSETNLVFESSAMPAFAFNNFSNGGGGVQKVDKYMSEKDADGGLLHHLEMSYDFFKKVAEATTNDLELDEAPSAEAGALLTGATGIATVLPPVRQQQQAAGEQEEEEGEGGLGGGSGGVLPSDEEAEEDEAEDSKKGRVRCPTCGRSFKSAAMMEANHSGSKTCTALTANKTVEARAVRMLKGMLDSGEAVVHGRLADISHVAPAAGDGGGSAYLRHFKHGWAKKPSHGNTKGHKYMTDEHRQKIKEYYDDGAKDKGKKSLLLSWPNFSEETSATTSTGYHTCLKSPRTYQRSMQLQRITNSPMATGAAGRQARSQTSTSRCSTRFFMVGEQQTTASNQRMGSRVHTTS